MKTSLLLFCMLIYGVCFPVIGNAQSNFSNQSWNVGFQGGVLFPGPGQVNIDPPGWAFETETGFVLGAEIDGYVAPKLSVGLKYLYSNASLKGFSDAADIHTIAGTIKARFNIGEKLQFRPGASFGYNRIEINSDVDGSNGFNVAGIFQYAYSLGNGKAITGEFSFISQPVGGNGDRDITFPPIMYLTIGYEFGN